MSNEKLMNSIKKGFLVLESLSEFTFPISLKLLTQKTRLPKPTLHRILQTLVETGYVTQEGTPGHYAISPKLAEVGNNRRYTALKEAAFPYMKALYNTFNETVNLATLVGTNIQYLDVLETKKPLRWIVKPGEQDAFYCTALGRAIVAFLPEDAREKLFTQGKLEQRTPSTMTDLGQLRKILQKTRDNGWALDDEENAIGVICFAAPMFQKGDPIAAISVSLPKSRLTPALRTELVHSLESLGKDLST